MSLKSFFLSLVFLLFSLSSFAQNEEERLARQYLNSGEFAKAVLLYEKLYEENPRSTHYYRNYYKALLGKKDFEGAEKLIKKQLKKRKNDINLLVDMGLLYKSKEELDKANEQFNAALDQVSANQVRSLASSFSNAGEYTLAVNTYLKGREMSNTPKAFGYELARAYQNLGETENMMTSYLDYSVTNPKNIQIVKNALQKVIKGEDYMDGLQRELYLRIQQEPDQIIYPEILTWAFIQQKDYESAVVQIKALDRRLGENGDRVMNLAVLASSDKEYNTAIEAYEYVIEKGPGNPLHTRAKIQLLKCRNQKITETGIYTKEDITKLESEYTFFLEEFGQNVSTIEPMRELSHLYAYYLNNIEPAKNLMQNIVDMPNASNQLKALSKLDLGDYYLIQNDIWEATLLYSQVDKMFKDDILGEEARFKNAKLAYYNADFEWAQAQLNVLKASTSELISNDALDLSVFITDNLGLDTTVTPMRMYATADLLIMQNKLGEAFQSLDSITTGFPNHVLEDDIYLTKAEVHIQQQEYEQAIPLLQHIFDNFQTDLLADDALFKMAELNEKHLDQEDKAMEQYQTLLVDFPNSLLAVEARKRFRALRGDAL